MDKGARPIGLETDSVLLKKGVNNDECGLSALYLGLEEIKEYLKQNFEVCHATMVVLMTSAYLHGLGMTDDGLPGST